MDKELKDIFQQSLPGIPESRLMTIVEIMADPEKHHRELLSLFKTGNHKIHADNSREELLTMPLINDFRKGNDASISRQPRVKEKDKFGYDWRVNIAKNGDVTVILREIDLSDIPKNDEVRTHEWLFTRYAVTHFLEAYPLSTYDNIRRVGLINDTLYSIIEPLRNNRDQVIAIDRRKDTVDEVHRDVVSTRLVFDKDINVESINPLHRYNMDRAAWCKCLLTVFMRVGYEEYYDNVYDVSRMFRDQPRFLDIQEDTGKFYDGAL